MDKKRYSRTLKKVRCSQLPKIDPRCGCVIDDDQEGCRCHNNTPVLVKGKMMETSLRGKDCPEYRCFRLSTDPSACEGCDIHKTGP